jgi:diguanylate cyclase (GGDEF)-like protein
MDQNGDQVRTCTQDQAPSVSVLEPFPSAPDQKRPLTAFFPLFYGSFHYGVFMVELEHEEMLFYYTLSLEIGTGIRYLAMSLAQQESQTALEEKNQILKFSASHDVLTGLYNRAGLMNLIFEQLRSQGPGTEWAVVMADLDHLKQINDTFGHSAGDEAIRTIASTLARALPPDSPLGRTGGDEFTGLMLLRDGYSVEWLQERIRQDVERFNRKSATPWYLGISVGCSAFVYSQPSQISEELEKADQHLYQAKALRRKSVIRIPPEEP